MKCIYCPISITRVRTATLHIATKTAAISCRQTDKSISGVLKTSQKCHIALLLSKRGFKRQI